MRLDRVGNTKRNIIVGELDRFLGIILPFIVRTMMIHVLGAEYLGLTSLFYSIVQMLNLAEMGFGSAIIYSMYKPIADNDSKAINALLKFYAVVYRVVGIVITVIGLLVIPFLPILTKKEVPADISVYVVYAIFLVNSFLNCVLFPNRRALISAFQREDINSNMHIIVQILMYGLQIIGIILTKNYYLYVLTIPVLTVTYALLCKWQFDKHFGIYKEEGELDDDIRADIKKQVVGLTVRRLATYSRNAFDSMFVSAYLGLKMNGIYGNYYYVMDSVIMIMAVIRTAMAGGVGNSIALESEEKNVQDMHRINFLFMLMAGWCTACLLCLYQPFMEIWVGKKMQLPFYMAVAFAAYFYILKMGDIRSLYAESVGIWWNTRYISIAEAAANIVLNWVFIKNFGVLGIVLATMISYFIFNFIGGAIILYRCYFKNNSLSEYFLKHVRYIIITACICTITYLITVPVTLCGIPGFLIKAVISAAVPVILYLIVYCRTEEFKNAMPLIRGLMRQKRDGK